MARTKQTARKSTGGRAPSKQLHLSSQSRVSRSLRNYLVSGQQLGHLNPSDARSKKGKASFLNSDSILGSFSFPSPPVENPTILFAPNLQSCKTKHPLNGSTESYVSMTFSSSCDGGFPETFPRPFLDVVIALDISGSMGFDFANDSSFRSYGDVGDMSKLSQAKKCLLSIFKALEPQDRFSIVLFNHTQDVWLEPTLKGNLDAEQFEEALSEIVPTGGTHLADGFEAGLSLFDQHPLTRTEEEEEEEVSLPEEGYYLHRILFMTDMQSGVEDEAAVLSLAEEWADRQATSFLTRIGLDDEEEEEEETGKRKRPRRSRRLSRSKKSSSSSTEISCSVFTTIIGIGVDLSVGSVERISSTRGGKYISVASAEEFEKSVASDFLFDMIPCIFNLKVDIINKNGYCIDAIYGSSELNSVPSGSTSFSISSEFPNPTPGTMNAILILKLKLDPSERKNKMLKKPKTPKKRKARESDDEGNEENEALLEALEEEQVAIKLSYVSLYGNRMSVSKITSLPSIVPEALPAMEEEEEEEEEEVKWEEGEVRQEREGSWTAPSIRKAVALVRFCVLQSDFATEDVPEDDDDIDARLKFHQEKVVNYKLFKTHLLNEMRICSESSLSEGGSNQNLLTTLDQMIEGEEKEVKFIFEDIRNKMIRISTRFPDSPVYRGPIELATIKEEEEEEEEKEEKKKEDNEITPSHFMCPITLEKMKDPVIAADGHSYERSAIEAWFASGKKTSPNTGLPLPHTHLVPNIALKNLIESS